MIFAAGLGTRLAPLTDRTPKALVAVKGRPLLGHVMDRLVAAGATRLIVNTSVHGDQIAEWLGKNAPAGVEIAISPEPDGPYDTGGGLAAAAHLFRFDGPIILHNVDVLSRIPLDQLLEGHRAARRRYGDKLVATMATQIRPSKRRVMFDDVGLMGWGDLRAREPVGATRELAFSGIHVIEPALLKEPAIGNRQSAIGNDRVFPIRDIYLDLVARGFIIRPADVSDYEWQDIGTPERLREAESRDW
jgi:NDP-sugar pyrophosphorylase family protein